jgi:hypothetical protein
VEFAEEIDNARYNLIFPVSKGGMAAAGQQHHRCRAGHAGDDALHL